MFIAYFYLLTQNRLTGKTHWYWYVLVSQVRQKTAQNTLETGTQKTKSDIFDKKKSIVFALSSMCVFVSVWTARFCRGSNGKLGLRHVPRGASPSERGDVLHGNQESHRQDRVPRARPPVVRKPGDHGVVGRAMAQRRVRQVQCDLFFAMPPVGFDDLQALAAGATATVSILLMSAFLRGG